MAKKSIKLAQKPAMTPEQDENECISLAFALAKEKLRDGTASSQLITEFIKAGSYKRELEIEELRSKVKLLETKCVSLESQRRSEDIAEKALQAFRTYAGQGDDDEFEF